MESRKTLVTVVDAYGRSAWLAVELFRRGYGVTVLDCSEAMGPWTLEDREGPFPLFRHDGLSGLQLESLFDPDPVLEASNGFVVHLGSDVVEMRGPLSSYKIPERMDWKDYLLQMGLVADPKNELTKVSKRTELILRVAHQMAATEMVPYKPHSLPMTPASFILGPLLLRRVSRPGYGRLNEWVRQFGITVVEKVSSVEVLESGELKYAVDQQFETLKSDRVFSGLRADELDWLRPVEKRWQIDERVRFDWHWTRYRLRLSYHELLKVIPEHQVIIRDLDLAWSHDNFLIQQSTHSLTEWDIWLRMPYSRRFDHQSIVEMSQKIAAIFSERMPMVNVESVDLPQEALYGFTELGPAPYALLQQEGPQPGMPGLTLLGPDTFKTYDKANLLLLQKQTLNKLEAIKK